MDKVVKKGDRMGMWVIGLICDFDKNKIYYNVAGFVDLGGSKIRVVEDSGEVDLTLKKEDVLIKFIDSELNHTQPDIIKYPDIATGAVVDLKDWGSYIQKVSSWFENEVPKYDNIVAGFFQSIIREE